MIISGDVGLALQQFEDSDTDEADEAIHQIFLGRGLKEGSLVKDAAERGRVRIIFSLIFRSLTFYRCRQS